MCARGHLFVGYKSRMAAGACATGSKRRGFGEGGELSLPRTRPATSPASLQAPSATCSRRPSPALPSPSCLSPLHHPSPIPPSSSPAVISSLAATAPPPAEPFAPFTPCQLVSLAHSRDVSPYNSTFAPGRSLKDQLAELSQPAPLGACLPSPRVLM